MRKLILLLTALLLCAAPALAEQPPVDEALVGEWLWALGFSENSIYTISQPERYTITADGLLTYDEDPTESMPLHYDEASGQWMLVSPEDSTQTAPLFIDDYGHLIFATPYEGVVFLRPDAAPAELSYEPHMATGGTWKLTGLLIPANADAGLPDILLDAASLALPSLTMTLPAFADHYSIRTAYAGATGQEAAKTFLWRLLFDGAELVNADTLRVDVHSSHFPSLSLLFTCTSRPEVERAVLNRAAELTGRWRLVEVNAGGLVFPMEAESTSLALDERGNALLDDDPCQLHQENGALCLGDYAIDLREESLYLTLDDGVQARYITESDWYRAQLNGTWQLSHVQVPSIGVDSAAADAAMDAQLIITPDGAILRQGADDLPFALFCTDDVTGYQLISADWGSRLLILSGPNLLTMCSESDSYTLSFQRAE